MRFSQLFNKTLRQEPGEAESLSHRLMLKAGMVHQLAAGLYSILPLGWRAYRKIEQIIREEMDATGAQELLMPALQPVEMWERSGRRQAFGETLFQLQDRKERWLCLAPTHEEVITLLASLNIQSYRDLPQILYQIQTKFRDEPRPRGGLIRVREFAMKDAYSFDADEEGLDLGYQKVAEAYHRIYTRCGLSCLAVEADSGAIGGRDSMEFILVAETGEDEVVSCPACSYAANLEKAQSRKPAQSQEPELPVEEVHTPSINTIELLAKFLGIPKGKTLKAVFYTADGEVLFAVIRGDLEINEVKLKNLLQCHDLHIATEEEVHKAGLVAGFASPRGVRGVRVVADDSMLLGSNFAAGANKPDYHLKNVNYPRDFQVEQVVDIARAQADHGCPKCGSSLQLTRGIEVGHVFKLGTAYSEKLGAHFLDRGGQRRPLVMGCYGIGVGRLLAAAVEQNHDNKGIIWPPPIAPFNVHLCALSQENVQVRETADSLYQELEHGGLSVLYDDRPESPGVKFNDADLLGMPLRLTVSPRTLNLQSVEVKKRKEQEVRLVKLEEALPAVREALARW